MCRPRVYSAFTLLELVLVMLIISIALAVAAPSMTGWGRSAKLRDETDQFLSITRYARTQAIATGTPYRLNVDSNAARYWLTRREGLDFVNFAGEFGQEFHLPAGYAIKLEKQTVLLTSSNPGNTTASAPADAANQPIVEFSVLGKSELAQVMITNDHGQSALVECPSPYDNFHRVDKTQQGAAS